MAEAPPRRGPARDADRPRVAEGHPSRLDPVIESEPAEVFTLSAPIKRLITIVAWCIVAVFAIWIVKGVVNRRTDASTQQTGNVAQQAASSTSRAGTPAQEAGCPHAHSRQTRECIATPNSEDWIKAEEGPAVDGMRICVDPPVESEEKMENGTFFVRFYTKSGRTRVRYRLVRLADGATCPQI